MPGLRQARRRREAGFQLEQPTDQDDGLSIRFAIHLAHRAEILHPGQVLGPARVPGGQYRAARKFPPIRYFGGTPKVRAKRSL